MILEVDGWTVLAVIGVVFILIIVGAALASLRDQG